MALSLPEFRDSLLNAGQRATWGILLTDDEARQVVADPASTQNWYEYWLSTQAPITPPPMAQATPDPTEAFGLASAPPPVVPRPDQFPTAVIDPGYGNAYTTAAAPPPYPGAVDAPPAPRRRRTGLWVTLSIVTALVLIVGGVFAYAFATARVWTKVDVPEQPETFHSETYKTGLYDVTMNDTSPCWVDQDWTDCVNLMVAQYNAACTEVELTTAGSAVCSTYLTEIDRMKSVDTGNYIVVSLGGYGSLSRTEEMSTRDVSNEDYKPAITHEAVCYLEFIGECE